MNQSAHKTSYRVDKVAWGIALGSLLTVVVLAYLVVTYTVSVYRNLYATRVHETITAGDFKDAEQDIENFFRGPPLLHHLEHSNSAVLHAGQDGAETLLHVVANLSPQSLDSAARQLDALHKRVSIIDGFPKPAAAVIAPLQQSLSRAASQEQTLEAAQVQKNTLLTQRATAQTEYNLLAKDTADLFSLPAANSQEPGYAPLFYDHGVLADLPSVPGLPDGIDSIDDLRVKLMAAGGNVHLSGENVQSIFNAKLANLRNSGKSLAETFNQLSQQLTTVNATVTDLSDQVRTDVDRISAQSDETIRRFMLSFGR